MKKAVAVTFAALTMGLGGTVSALAADLARYEPAPQEQDDRNGVKIGYLTCDIGGGVGYVIGSAKELDCTFQSTMGARRTDHYTGAIRKMEKERKKKRDKKKERKKGKEGNVIRNKIRCK